MATPQELAAYNAQKDLLERNNKVMNALFKHPELGAGVRKLAKELLPDIEVPEDKFAPMVEPVKAELDALKEELAAMRKERKERDEKDEASRAEDNMKAALEGARKKFNLTDEGFKLMTERMVATKNYSDAEAAAAWVAAQNPPPKKDGPTWGPSSVNIFGRQEDEESKALLHRDPIAWQDKILDEFMNGDKDEFVRRALQ